MTTPLTVSSLSLEYVRVPVTATEDGAAVNPTTDAVVMAFVTPGSEPASGDWKSASWETAGSTYYARCLVGPGGAVTLGNGTFAVFVKITDSPEIPVIGAGLLTVT